jgi:hypothetical protein
MPGAIKRPAFIGMKADGLRDIRMGSRAPDGLGANQTDPPELPDR